MKSNSREACGGRGQGTEVGLNISVSCRERAPVRLPPSKGTVRTVFACSPARAVQKLGAGVLFPVASSACRLVHLRVPVRQARGMEARPLCSRGVPGLGREPCFPEGGETCDSLRCCSKRGDPRGPRLWPVALGCRPHPVPLGPGSGLGRLSRAGPAGPWLPASGTPRRRSRRSGTPGPGKGVPRASCHHGRLQSPGTNARLLAALQDCSLGWQRPVPYSPKESWPRLHAPTEPPVLFVY